MFSKSSTPFTYGILKHILLPDAAKFQMLNNVKVPQTTYFSNKFSNYVLQIHKTNLIKHWKIPI